MEKSLQVGVQAPSMCNMCCRKDEVCVNLEQNHTLVLTVSDITRLPSWHIRQILHSVCSRCLVYISAITDSSSKLRMRCEQAMHSQNILIAPPTPDTSPNNFLQVSRPLLDDTPANLSADSHNCYGPNECSSIPNDTLPLASSSPPHSSAIPTTLKESRSRSHSPNNAGQNSMLQICYERPMSPLNTESGGGGKGGKRNYQRVQVIPVQMICTRCSRAYWRKDFYRKHVRRCGAKSRYAKSMVSQRSRSQFELDAVSVLSEGNEELTSQRKAPIFRCKNCVFTAQNITELRKHKQSHLPQFVCEYCNFVLNSQNEYHFHQAQCMSKSDAPLRCRTRSFSRARSVAKSPEGSTITSYVKRNRSLYGTSRSGTTHYEDDDDDQVSVADTLYSKRMSLTNHWVEEHSLSSQSQTSYCDSYINDFKEYVAAPTLKEYDLYLLERLKIEVKLNFVNCYEKGCRYTSATLNQMMVHDYIYHYKNPWFSCHKCGHCFTSKVFLDYHLHLQNKGRYVCHICAAIFIYQNQLDRHLIKHDRVVKNGGEEYECNYCNLRFMEEEKLFIHCQMKNHDRNQQRETIEIDHSMSISNKINRIRKKKGGNKAHFKILIMKLEPMPSKRCIPMEKYRSHLPSHLRIPKRIGQIEFKYPTNPNCVGCL